MLSTSMLYFREVARTGSLRRAAEGLGIAPGAISRQIANLEAELKVLLLDRRANRTTLTSAGELVFAHAEVALQESETLRTAARAWCRRALRMVARCDRQASQHGTCFPRSWRRYWAMMAYC